MAATHVQSASGSGTGTSASVTFGGAIAEGDMLTAVLELGNTSGGFTAINGYALVPTVISQFAMAWKIAGAGESLTQTPLQWVTSRDWHLGMADHAPGSAIATHDVSNSVADATSPQDLAAINPTDSIDTVMVGGAGNDVLRTYSSQSIGGSAATERVDSNNGTNASVTVFDRLNVDTSTSTFAAQATASGAPDNGGIGLVIYKLTPIVAGVARHLGLLGVGK